MGTERLSVLTLFKEEEEGAEEEVEEEENGWVRDHLKEKQSGGLGEVLPMEMEEDSILRPLWKEVKKIDRKRNGQALQVMGEEDKMYPFLPSQYRSHNKGPHPLLLYLKIDFSWIEIV